VRAAASCPEKSIPEHKHWGSDLATQFLYRPRHALSQRLARSFWNSSTWRDPLIVSMFVALVRLPGVPPSVIDWDESIYTLMARELLWGRLPYVHVFDDKAVGAPAMIAAALSLFGNTMVSVRLLGMVAVAATSLLLWAIARRAGLGRAAGLAAALLYGGFSTALGGLSTNTELLFAPLVAGAMLVALRGADQTRLRGQLGVILGAGALIGLAVWIKLVAAVPGAMLFALLVGAWLWRRQVSLLAVPALAAAYAVICVAPTALTGAYYAWQGQFPLFWYCNFGFIGAYVGLKADPTELFRSAEGALLQIWPLLLMGAAAVALAWRQRSGLVFIALALAWLGAELAAVVAPWKFFNHYFLVLLPPLALLSGFCLDRIAAVSVLPALRSLAAPVLAACVALVPLSGVAGRISPRWLNIGRPDVSRQVAAIIRASGPGATAWVVNSEPVIYFLAGIDTPTRFPFPPHLVGSQFSYAHSDPPVEIARILASRPRFLVVDEGRWGEVEAPLQPQIKAALAQDYELFRSIEAKPADVDVFRLKQ
jgi:4-amino-4-deoxy-L-arabinose transferase-like glycosyltransferase